MDRIFTPPHKNEEISTTSVGSFGTFQNYPGITTLLNEIRSDKNIIVTLDQLEMFEAELINQGIIRQGLIRSSRLSHHLAYDINLYRWHALRLGINSKKLVFKIDLSKYICHYAHELITSLSSLAEKSPTTALSAGLRFPNHDRLAIEQTLKYLNDLARYIISDDVIKSSSGTNSARNRYEQGLNLVLRSLFRPKPQNIIMDENGVQTVIILPLSKQEFISRLKRKNKQPKNA